MTDQAEIKAGGQIPAQKPQRLINLPPVVVVLIAVLVAIQIIIPFTDQKWVYFAFAFIPARFGSAIFPQLVGSAYWSMFTYGFLHADWVHLASNSLWLAIFSKPVATWLGWWRYLVLFTASVIAGAVAGLIVHWGQNVTMVGASAGVSGVLGAAIPIMYGGDNRAPGKAIGMMYQFRPLSPGQLLTNRRALTFTIMWLGLTMITATSQYMTGTAFLEERVIAWEAHLGGFVVGLISFYLLDRRRFI